MRDRTRGFVSSPPTGGGEAVVRWGPEFGHGDHSLASQAAVALGEVNLTIPVAVQAAVDFDVSLTIPTATQAAVDLSTVKLVIPTAAQAAVDGYSKKIARPADRSFYIDEASPSTEFDDVELEAKWETLNDEAHAYLLWDYTDYTIQNAVEGGLSSLDFSVAHSQVTTTTLRYEVGYVANSDSPATANYTWNNPPTFTVQETIDVGIPGGVGKVYHGVSVPLTELEAGMAVSRGDWLAIRCRGTNLNGLITWNVAPISGTGGGTPPDHTEAMGYR